MKGTRLDQPIADGASTSPEAHAQGRDALVAATGVGLGLTRYSQLRYFDWEEPEASGRASFIRSITLARLATVAFPYLCAFRHGSRGRSSRCGPRREEFTVRPGRPLAPPPMWRWPRRLCLEMLNYAIGRNPGVYWSTHSYDVLVNTAPGLWSPKGIEELFAAAGDGAMPAIVAVWMLQRLAAPGSQPQNGPIASARPWLDIHALDADAALNALCPLSRPRDPSVSQQTLPSPRSSLKAPVQAWRTGRPRLPAMCA